MFGCTYDIRTRIYILTCVRVDVFIRLCFSFGLGIKIFYRYEYMVLVSGFYAVSFIGSIRFVGVVVILERGRERSRREDYIVFES